MRDEGVLTLTLGGETDAGGNLAEHIDGDRYPLGDTNPRHADDGVGVPVEHAGLHRVGNADTDVASLLARGGLLAAQRGIVGAPQYGVQGFFVFAAVVLVATRDRVRELLRADVVAPAYLGGVHGELAGGNIDHLLQHEKVRWRSHAAIGAGRQFVAENDGDVIGRDGDGVTAGERRQRLAGTDRAVILAAGADIVDQPDPQPGEPAIVHHRQLRLVEAVPRLAAAAGEVLDAILYPFDRSATGFA